MDLNEIKNGKQYADLLIDTIKETVGDMDEQLKDLWYEEITEAAEQSYLEYIKGKKDDFTLTEKEMFDSYERAGMRHTEQIVGDLIDKGALDAFIDEKGQVVYKLSEYGKQVAKNQYF